MTIKYSENKIFAVDTEDFECIYIHKSEVENQLETNTFISKYMKRKNGGNPKLNKYKKYTSTIDLTSIGNDCLMLTEGIIRKNLSKLSTEKAWLRAKDDDTQRLVGHSDTNNLKIAENLMTKKKYFNKVLPEIGEGYIIIKREVDENDSDCPYHAAAVIFKDGNSTVTLEADSGNESLEKPIFDIYTAKKRKSFYDTYANDYEINRKKPALSVLSNR